MREWERMETTRTRRELRVASARNTVRLVASIALNVFPIPPPGEEENEQSEFMVQCDTCKAWQHGSCMHYDASENVPQQYFCEECRPDLWGEVLRCAACHFPTLASPDHVLQRLGHQAFPAFALSSTPHPIGSHRASQLTLPLSGCLEDHEAQEYHEQPRCCLR